MGADSFFNDDILWLVEHLNNSFWEAIEEVLLTVSHLHQNPFNILLCMLWINTIFEFHFLKWNIQFKERFDVLTCTFRIVSFIVKSLSNYLLAVKAIVNTFLRFKIFHMTFTECNTVLQINVLLWPFLMFILFIHLFIYSHYFTLKTGSGIVFAAKNPRSKESKSQLTRKIILLSN